MHSDLERLVSEDETALVQSLRARFIWSRCRSGRWSQKGDPDVFHTRDSTRIQPACAVALSTPFDRRRTCRTRPGS
jgi:hypothetical protein